MRAELCPLYRRGMHEFDRYADIAAALADPHLVPLPATSGPVGGIAWLRATVARFSSGQTHARRRALVEADLARLDPLALRKAVALDPGADVRQPAARVPGPRPLWPSRPASSAEIRMLRSPASRRPASRANRRRPMAGIFLADSGAEDRDPLTRVAVCALWRDQPAVGGPVRSAPGRSAS